MRYRGDRNRVEAHEQEQEGAASKAKRLAQREAVSQPNTDDLHECRACCSVFSSSVAPSEPRDHHKATEHSGDRRKEELTTTSALDQASPHHRQQPIPNRQSSIDTGLLCRIREADLVQDFAKRQERVSDEATSERESEQGLPGTR